MTIGKEVNAAIHQEFSTMGLVALENGLIEKTMNATWTAFNIGIMKDTPLGSKRAKTLGVDIGVKNAKIKNNNRRNSSTNRTN